MEKQIFMAVCDRLKQVDALRWIDADEGQLQAAERPPVSFPCCLVEMAYPSCEQLSSTDQRVSVRFRLTLAFDDIAPTNNHVPTAVRDKALRRLDVLQQVHETLQWWDNDRMFMPMRRVSVSPVRHAQGMKVYEATYETGYLDTV